MAKNDPYQVMTDYMLKQMETAGQDWLNPFRQGKNEMAQNFTTKNPYHGVNIPVLTMSQHAQGFKTNQWATYKQWQNKGKQVNKKTIVGGGTPVIFFKMLEKKKKKETDKTEFFPFPKISWVYNIEQLVDWELDTDFDIPKTQENELSEIELSNQDLKEREIVRKVCKDAGIKVEFDVVGSAFYRPLTNSCHVPTLENIEGSTPSERSARQNGTILHEASHATGHPTRLDRQGGKRFGDRAYSYEELIAELSSAFLGSALGVKTEARQDHAKYLNGWVAAMKEDNKIIYSAAKEAQKACEWILEAANVKTEAA